ncbi:MAG: DUF47 family protein [Ancrocorticia sp.]|nr:DUF47 family protein [Ancrocorticia sp.]MCI1963120.1 DUF47 family protein [Ancrocorticia sp.]MCI2001488.1 DUF47 family protein [Ancrocorticia sp.]MCI2013286.1 DUF47 family protein [Ancrocorticia sp.]MCI2030037.1 DUF47 family protein [Ancrocorticia sp.]
MDSNTSGQRGGGRGHQRAVHAHVTHSRRPWWKRARRALNEVGGRSARNGVEAIADQIRVAIDAAVLAAAMADRSVQTRTARENMVEIEHAGDDHRAELVRALGAALSTPVDREDLYRLSRSVDDVVDNLRDYVRESDLYQPSKQPGADGILAAVEEGMRSLLAAVDNVIPNPRAVMTYTMAARKSCNNIRNLYEHQLAELFAEPVNNDVLKRRELLRRLDVVGLRMGEAADALSDGMLKRSL